MKRKKSSLAFNLVKIDFSKYRNVYHFFESGDRRSAEFKKIESKVKEISNKYGKDSKELNDYFDSTEFE